MAYKTYQYGSKIYYQQPGVAGLNQITNPSQLQSFASQGLIDEKANPRQTLSTDPNPAPTPAGTTDTPYRYPTLTGLNSNSPYNKEASTYFNGLDRTAPNSTEQSQIYNDSLAMYQQQIDSINSLYNQLVSQENVVGQDRLGQTRAMGAASGLLGSPRGSAQMDKTQVMNDKAVQAIRQEQGYLVSQVMTDVRKRADDKIAAESTLARTNAKDYLDFLKGQQTEARDNMVSLAKGGVPLSQLSDEDYKSLLESTGYDPLLFESIYNQNDPAKSVKYEYKQFGDTVVRVGDDGTFKEIGDFPTLKGGELKQLADGTLVVFDPNTNTYTDYGNYGKPDIQGSAGGGYFYVTYENGVPKMNQLTRGTDNGSGGENTAIIDYMDAIESINSMSTITSEQAKQPMSQEGMTKEAKEAAIRNIKTQAAEALKSTDYNKLMDIAKSLEVDKSFGYKITIDPATGVAGIWDEDAGRFLTQTEQNSYNELKKAQSFTF